MIKLHQVCAGYGEAEKLHGIDLLFEQGKLTIVAGPNGCGKSTLLKAIGGLLPLTHGSIMIGGRHLGEFSPKELAQTMALLPQSRNVPGITARRLVLHGRFPYLGYPRRYRQEDYQVVQRAMEQTGTLHLANASLENLSGGERQKVYLAMAFAQDTPVVLLDEPTTYLDVRHQLEVMALAQKMTRQGKTVVLVLHDLNLALQYADAMVVMENGVVAGTGKPYALVQSGLIDRVFGVTTKGYTTEGGEKCFAFCRQKSMT